MALTDALNTSSNGYYEPDFRRVLEEHLPLIKKRQANTVLAVEPYLAVRFKGDFFGLLAHLQVPDYLQWITMRVNGFISPMDVNDDIRTVTTVDATFIRRLYNTHRTQSKIKRKN